MPRRVDGNDPPRALNKFRIDLHPVTSWNPTLSHRQTIHLSPLHAKAISPARRHVKYLSIVLCRQVSLSKQVNYFPPFDSAFFGTHRLATSP